MATTRPRLTKVVTPAGIASYPHLTTPDTFKNKTEFKTNLILDPAEDGVQAFLDKVSAAAEAAYAAGLAGLNEQLKEAKGKAINTLKEGIETLKCHLPYEPEYADNGDETGKVVVKFKCLAGGVHQSGNKKGESWSRNLPIFDSQKNHLDSKTLRLWGGSIIRVQAEMNPYCMLATEKAGVSLRLYSVQLIKPADGGSGDGDGFGIEDGYVGEPAGESTSTVDSPAADQSDDEEDF